MSEFGEDGEGERQIVKGTMEIGLLRRSGNVERVVRKPEVAVEQDLIAPEGESGEWLSGIRRYSRVLILYVHTSYHVLASARE